MNNVKRGMYLSKPVYKGQILIMREGIQLEVNHIISLKKNDITEIEISYEPVEDDNQEFGLWQDEIDCISENHDKSREEIYQLVQEEINLMLKYYIMEYSNFTPDQREEYGKQFYTLFVQEILSKDHFLDCVLDIKSIDSYTYLHSIRVSVLSLIIAASMDLRWRDLYHIGVGALFHDIGKIKVPQEVLFSDNILNPQEKTLMERHTISGYEVLIRIPDISEESVLIALQHHERIDGTGYPYKLKGDKIHIFSKIVSIADTFEAMTAERSYRKAHNPSEIIEFLMGSSNIFDRRAVKALLKGVSVYKIGSVVRLNNNESGVVIKFNSKLPTRPVIRKISNSDNLRLRRHDLIDLSSPDNTTLSIVRVFG